MKKTVLLVLTIVMASVMGGCSFFSGANDAKEELEATAKKPIPRVNSKPRNSQETEEAKTEEESEEFADLEEEESEATQAIAGLIPATDPDSRVRNSVRGRTDPFSVVSLIPEIEVEQPKVKSQPVSNRNTRTNRERNSISQNPNNSQKLSNPLDEFRTKLAQEVVISGLYESNGRTKLIVRAPEEDNSRYVEVGQYLSNGQILTYFYITAIVPIIFLLH